MSDRFNSEADQIRRGGRRPGFKTREGEIAGRENPGRSGILEVGGEIGPGAALSRRPQRGQHFVGDGPDQALEVLALAATSAGAIMRAG